MTFILDYLSSEGFQPHGMCLLWRPDVFWSHAVSDIIIAVSYFSIPVALLYFARRRPDLAYPPVVYLFCAFITACGVTHIFGLWTLWVPDYGAEGIVKVVTALISAITAILLWPLMPKALAIPSAKKLEEKNEDLAKQIAEREAVEAELRTVNYELVEAKVQAEQANIAKSEFLALMSHEVRTPLNGILATADLMAHKNQSEEQRHYAEIVRESGQSLLDIVNRILDLSRIEAGVEKVESAPFSISDLIGEAENLWQSKLAEKKLEHSFRIADDVPPNLVGDSSRVREILNNIIGNAVKFTQEGSIDVSVSRDRTSPEQDEKRICLRIEVDDTGKGISSDKLEKVFERFEQGDASLSREYEGTGLGLAICREYVSLLDGDIGVSSTEGVGSKFWFTFRCAVGDDDAAQADPENPADNSEQPPSLLGRDERPLKILVAEDNKTNRILIKDILEQFGYDTTVVTNGSEAIAEISRDYYDLILMDIRMPVMDGLTATETIRKMNTATAHVPIIALTAHAMVGDRERYIEAGMNDYISKPFTIASIERTLSRFVSTF